MKVNSRAVLTALLGIVLLTGCAAAAAEQSIPTELSEVPRMTPKEVKALLESGERVVFVDTRSRAAYEQDHIPGALSIPLNEIEARHTELPKDRQIVLYCT